MPTYTPFGVERIPITVVPDGNGGYTLATTLVSSSAIAAAGESHIGSVGGQILIASHEFTRPGDATPYSINDAVANSTSSPTVGSFTIGRVNGGSGYVIGVSVTHELASVTPRIRVHFFNVAPTGVNDNAALGLTYAIVSGAGYLGHIDLPAMTTDGGTDYSRAQVETSGKLLEYVCAGNDNKIYYLTQTLDGFTPGNAKKWITKVKADVN